MADFTSGFWSWFIAITTLASIFGLFWFTWLQSRGKKPGEQVKTMGHVWDEDLEEYNNPLPRWWLNLFYITLVFALIYLALYPGLGSFEGLLKWTQLGQYEQEMKKADAALGPLYAQYVGERIETLSRNPRALRTGARLYNNYCAVCHGSDARGAPGFPNLRDADWLYGGTPKIIMASILNGRNGVMPPWQPVLQDEGVANMTEYVRSLSGRKHDPAKAAAGGEKFKQLCVACHKADGSGNPAIGAPNLSDRVWLYGGSARSIAKSIAEGRNGRMPPHKEFLGEAKVHILAAYVYSLSADFERE